MDIRRARERLNEIFTDIVVVITQLIDLSEKNIVTIQKSSGELDKNIKQFLTTISKNLSEITAVLHTKLTDIDMDALQQDIETSATSFMEIINNLKLLSLNAICQTKDLTPQQRTIISMISTEIKNISDNAEEQLVSLKKQFDTVFEQVSNISSFYDNLKNIDVQDKELNLDKLEELQISADVSTLIEYSQFHDIFRQQLEKIEQAYLEINWEENTLYEIGKKIKFYELAISMLEEIKTEVTQTIDELSTALKNYLYNLNTDIQNMFSKVGIVSEGYEILNNSRTNLFNDLDKLLDQTNKLLTFIKEIHRNIEQLQKFRKDFYNLKVVTNIEVVRMGASHLINLVESMENTYDVLLNLINKIKDIIELWENFSLELHTTITESFNLVKSYQEQNTQDSLNDIIKTNTEIDKELAYIKELLVEKDYLNKLQNYKEQLISEIDTILSKFQEDEQQLKSSLNPQDRETEDFQAGYNSLEIETIKACEENIATIELF
ncbi:MAG: hypothetical protein Q9M37_10550 [Desulfonauticus sp.]|nr:hypothetical protein [Desulfonauticus sp.]